MAPGIGLCVASANSSFTVCGPGFSPTRTTVPPLVLLQHFMGTLDNWDPAVTDTLAAGREVILFDNAGIGRSTGTVEELLQAAAN